MPTSKGNLWLSGQNPARGKPLSTLPNFTNANHAIGYAAECGEQDFIDTTPFSLLKVLFDYPGRIPRGQDFIDTTQEKG